MDGLQSSRLARYELGEMIGEGGMGEVYQALDSQSGQPIALKALKSKIATPELVERFRREGQALVQLNHPNIVKMLDAFQENERHYLVLEYVGGGSLRELLNREKRLPVEQVLKIGLELSDALARAHLLGIVHRDIKPANILLAEDGTPRLTDFGIAQLSQKPTITQTGALIGTMDYISPEATRTESIDHRSDIWSFGVVLYEMLAGKAPFTRSNVAATLSAILNDAPPNILALRPDTPPDLALLLERMLSKNLSERINSVRLVGADIEAILNGARTSVGRGSLGTSSGDPRHDNSTQSPRNLRGTSQFTPSNAGHSHNLPSEITQFVGRDAELAELSELLVRDEVHLVTLLAPGGMGKTRLSIEAARRAIHRFDDGVFFVELAPLSSAENIPSAIAEAIGYEFFGGESPQKQIINFLHEKNLLLVLDNFEHVMAGADFVAELLKAAPHLKLLVTSRERLNLRSEWLIQIEGMAIPTELDPQEAEDYGAVQLFVLSARRVWPDFRLTAENTPYIIEICGRVGGMPLGIELAAAWVESLSEAEILSEIENSLDFLATDLRDVPERHRSMRAVFDYSWQLLTDAERDAFERLSIFRGGFTREAAAQITGTNLRVLSALSNKSLLRRASNGRYEVHELLRQYADEQLCATPECRAENYERYADYYLALISRDAEIYSPHYIKVIHEIDQDIENVRQALKIAVELGKAQALYHTRMTLSHYFETRSLYQEANDTFGMIAAAFKHDPSELGQKVYGQALTRQGMHLARLSHYAEGRELIISGAAIANRLGDIEEEALAYSSLSYLMMQVGEYEDARSIGEEALRLMKETNNQGLAAQAMGNQGYLLFLMGDYEGAKSLISTCCNIDSGTINSYALAYEHNNLGEVMRALGNFQEAGRLFKASYDLFTEIGSKRGIAFSLNNLAGIHQTMGDYDEAERQYRRAYRLNKEVGNRVGEGHSLSALGSMAFFTSQHEQALDYFQQSLALRREIDDQRGEADSLTDVGSVLLYLERINEAVAMFEESLVIRREMGDQASGTRALNFLGEAALRADDLDKARDYFQMAYDQAPASERHNLLTVGWALTNLSALEIELGQYAEAKARLIPLLDQATMPQFEWARAYGNSILAEAELGLGNHEAARLLLIEGLQIAVESQHPIALSYAMGGAAGWLMSMDERELALSALTSVFVYDVKITYAMAVRRGNRLMRQIRAQLSEKEFERLNHATQSQSGVEIAQMLLARLRAN